MRELAEELGIECAEEELEFVFTVPAEQAQLGGCNCFEDVYFLARSSDVKMAIGEAEVTAVAWMVGGLDRDRRLIFG